MRIAVIGDIHSNLLALQSVMDDINCRNADLILCTGDLTGYSPFPNEVIDLLRKNNVLSIQGNYDKAIGNREIICGCDYKEKWLEELAVLSVQYTNNTINDVNRKYLRNLPKELRLKFGEFELVLVHGSPRKINEPLNEDSQELYEVIKEIKEDILICGHTHMPYYKKIDDRHVINCGTVGKPVNNDPRATFAVVEIHDNIVDVEIVSVEYDFESAAKAIEKCEYLPDDFAGMLRRGSIYDKI